MMKERVGTIDGELSVRRHEGVGFRVQMEELAFDSYSKEGRQRYGKVVGIFFWFYLFSQ